MRVCLSNYGSSTHVWCLYWLTVQRLSHWNRKEDRRMWTSMAPPTAMN